MTDFYRLTPEAQALAMAELARAALGRWGLADADVALLKLRENAVFRVSLPGAPLRVLRVHRHNYHSDVNLLSELQWMQALRQAGIEVPEVIPSTSGRLFEIVGATAVPELRQVDLLGWLNGAPLGAIGESLAGDETTLRFNFHRLGRLAAQVHNQASGWCCLPDGFSRHAWDADGLTGENPFWGRFWELGVLNAEQRRLLLRARSRAHADLLRLDKSPQTYSMIHADLVPENVLVDGERLRLLDFDDAGFGWHQFEIVTAVIFHLGQPYFELIRDAFITGYREQRSLPDAALELLPLFMLARSFTYVGWAHTRAETQLAQEITPFFVETACTLSDAYLSR